MDQNGESVYGCGKSNFSKPEWGRWTQNGKNLYAHILDRGIGPINLRNMAEQIAYARLLADGSEIQLNRPWNTVEYPKDTFITFKTADLPDGIDTVVKLVLK